jgi:hypothetical protein
MIVFFIQTQRVDTGSYMGVRCSDIATRDAAQRLGADRYILIWFPQQIEARRAAASAGHPTVHLRRHGGGGASLPLHVRMPSCTRRDNGAQHLLARSAVTCVLCWTTKLIARELQELKEWMLAC